MYAYIQGKGLGLTLNPLMADIYVCMYVCMCVSICIYPGLGLGFPEDMCVCMYVYVCV